MPGPILGFLAAAIVLVLGARWLWQMRRVRIPQRKTAVVAGNAFAAALAIAAFASGPGLPGGIAAGIALLASLPFLALVAASGQSRRPPAVAVGEPVLAFEALDAEGRRFATGGLRGRPFLLKFFRGHWCPYCVAELRRWEEMRSELDARGVVLVTVCADTAEAIRAGRGKHGLAATMLPDPELAITDRFGLRNPRNFAPKPGLILPLPIPTTILVDAAGIVRWIDQATDYMHRSDPDVVLGAVRDHLDAAPEAVRERRAVAAPIPTRTEGRSPSQPDRARGAHRRGA